MTEIRQIISMAKNLNKERREGQRELERERDRRQKTRDILVFI